MNINIDNKNTLNKFLFVIEHQFENIMKIDQFELGSVFSLESMKNRIGGIFAAYIAISANLYPYFPKDLKEELNLFLEEISSYSQYKSLDLSEKLGLEVLQKNYNKYMSIINKLRD